MLLTRHHRSGQDGGWSHRGHCYSGGCTTRGYPCTLPLRNCHRLCDEADSKRERLWFHQFTIIKRKSRRYPEVKISDTDYADDLSLLTDTIEQAQEFLLSLEEAAAAVGLHLNEGKTKFMATGFEEPSLTTTSGRQLEHVQDFVYLGAHLRSTEHDLNVRKAKAWAACHRLRSIWRTDLRRSCKVNLFRTTVEAILLYGADSYHQSRKAPGSMPQLHSKDGARS